MRLNEAVLAADAEPTLRSLDRVRSRRWRAAQHATRLRERALARGAARSLPPSVEAQLATLWRELDYLQADPVGQRARLDVAREILASALRESDRGHPLRVSFRGSPAAPGD